MSTHIILLDSPNGQLELLSKVPTDLSSSRSPLLFVHGSFCSAHCYMNFLPYLAKHGYPAYAVSVRGHGASWQQCKFTKMLCTTVHSWIEDIQVALAYISNAHPYAPPPVLGGHSLGGGVLQHMLSSGSPGKTGRISAMILLGAAPLFGGGKEIMKNWQKVEAPYGYPYFFSERCLLHTPEQVKAAFFSEETDEDTVFQWVDMCKTKDESARVGLSIFRRVGEASRVLEHLDGFSANGRTRKVLCIAGEDDKLVLPTMVLDNADAYQRAATAATLGVEVCLATQIEGSGHHLMMDAHWPACAQAILRWLDGDSVAWKHSMLSSPS